jgi:hypothetical protein
MPYSKETAKLTPEEKKEKRRQQQKRWRDENKELQKELALKYYYKKNAPKDIDYYIQKHERMMRIVGGQA